MHIRQSIIRHPFKTGLILLLLTPVFILFFWFAHEAFVNWQCRDDAETLLRIHHSQYSFSRCSRKTYKTADGLHSISRVYVVAGNVSRAWEFECGYMAMCARYTGWFDENGRTIDFIDPPKIANKDPSVYTLGCGAPNSRSIYDTPINPQLIYKDGSYWWKIDYSNTPASKNPLCVLNGTSLLRHKEAVSSVQAEYQFNTVNCRSYPPSDCQTVRALMNRSVDYCRYSARSAKTYYDSYDYRCVTNYISRTGDKTLCEVKVNYGEVKCNNLTFIQPSL